MYVYVYGQDLGTVLKCCFLGSPHKIMPYGFFSHRMKVDFLVKWPHGSILSGEY